LDPASLLEPALLASLAALLVGPLVFERVRNSWALAGVDAFALVAVGGLVALHILPQSFALAGWKAAPVFLFGLFGPGFLCGTRILAGATGSKVTLPLALFGIALHAVLDGVALTSGDALALAVVLHRVSDGLGLWWLARPAYGRRVATVLLGTLAVFSVLGFLFAAPIVSGASHGWFALLQVLIAGSLLHVILRHPPAVPREATARSTAFASGVGGLIGLALVLSLQAFAAEGAHAAHGARGELFVELALESAPALLAAYLAVALLHAWEIDLAGLLGRGRSLAQAVRGTLVGLPMPICSCGVIPLYRDLVLHGVPLPAALSFLMAAPELGVTAIFLSVSLLGAEITLVRAACAAVLALTVGLVVGRRAPVSEPLLPRTPRHERAPFSQRLAGGLRYGLGDMVDSTAPWILVGLAVAALLSPWLDTGSLGRLSPALQVPLFALIGMPLYVCASGSTPLVAVLLAKGVSPGAAIAFLLTGPATNITTFGVVSRLHSRRTAFVFAVTTALVTTALGWGANALLGDRSASVATRLQESHGSNALDVVCLAGLAVLFAISLLRNGTRSFVGQVISPHGASALPHEHEHEHGDHGHQPGAHASDRNGCCEAPARSH